MKKMIIDNPEMELEKSKKELLALRMKKASGDTVKLHRFRELRVTVARCFTKLSEKNRGKNNA